ncbi:helix-turn-helix domain-containing protein [Nocardioidaceae bacterium]|nr:helix-turn-helix domain-containing protein [Nocardioidaceae bacterium]
MALQRRSTKTPSQRSAAYGPLAAVLATRRQELDLSQQDLADLAGVARGSVIAAESGRPITNESLLALLDVLGLHLQVSRGRTPGGYAVSTELAGRYGLDAADDTDDVSPESR